MVITNGTSFARKNGTKRKSENNIEFSFNRNNKSKSYLCSTTVATIVSKLLSSAIHLKFKRKPLHILLDSGIEEGFINKRWTTYEKLTKQLNL